MRRGPYPSVHQFSKGHEVTGTAAAHTDLRRHLHEDDGAGNDGIWGRYLQERKLRFEVAVKQYCFHFWPTSDPTNAAVEAATEAKATYSGLFGGGKAVTKTTYSARALQDEVAHYGSCAYEALYEGYFIDPVSAKQYITLFQSAQKGPYSQAALQANSDQLASLVSRPLFAAWHALNDFANAYSAERAFPSSLLHCNQSLVYAYSHTPAPTLLDCHSHPLPHCDARITPLSFELHLHPAAAHDSSSNRLRPAW